MTKTKKPKTKRQLQIGEVIKRLIAKEIYELVEFDVDNDFLSIMKAEISPDLRYCKVFYRCKIKNIEAFQKLLDGVAGEFSNLIYKRLKMRVRPEIKFIFDDTLYAIDEIQKVIERNKEYGE